MRKLNLNLKTVTPSASAIAATISKPAPVAKLDPIPAKPTGHDLRNTQHIVADTAVSEFYNDTDSLVGNASLPFNGAGDRLTEISPTGNHRAGDAPTLRRAALLYCMLVYSAGNIQPDGTFRRGAFRVPAGKCLTHDQMRKLGLKPGDLLDCQPESGALNGTFANPAKAGGWHAIAYVSGDLSPKAARDSLWTFTSGARRYLYNGLSSKPDMRKRALALFDKLCPACKQINLAPAPSKPTFVAPVKSAPTGKPVISASRVPVVTTKPNPIKSAATNAANAKRRVISKLAGAAEKPTLSTGDVVKRLNDRVTVTRVPSPTTQPIAADPVTVQADNLPDATPTPSAA